MQLLTLPVFVVLLSSGTPSHESFDDIQCLAQLIGLHLGIDEPLPGAKIAKGGKRNQNTAAESMANYLEVKSLAWHQRRHRIGTLQNAMWKRVW